MYNHLVTIRYASNKGVIGIYKEPVDTLVNATRIILTFKARKNYAVYSYEISDYSTLV